MRITLFVTRETQNGLSDGKHFNFGPVVIRFGESRIATSGGGILVATRVLNNMEVESTDPVRLGDVFPASLLEAYQSALPAFAKGSERASDGSAGDGHCFSGAFVAIALEAVAVLGAFGIWQLWHFLR